MPAHVPPVADERESLIAYLDQQRDAFASVAFGLTEEQIRVAPTAGTLTIGGLIKHVTTCAMRHAIVVTGGGTGSG